MMSDPAILAANTIITNGLNNISNETQKMNNLFAPESNENQDPNAQSEKSKFTAESNAEGKFFLNKVNGIVI
jgi:hypothetical protein